MLSKQDVEMLKQNLLEAFKDAKTEIVDEMVALYGKINLETPPQAAAEALVSSFCKNIFSFAISIV